MTEREVVPRLPTSGQVIGALVTRLGIRHPLLQERTARRYFAGRLEKLVKENSEAEIFGAFAEALVDAGFIASPRQLDTDDNLVPPLAGVLQWHASNWDQLRSFLRPRMMRVLPGQLSKVWEAYVRLAVIDLALRIAAHLHLAGSSPTALGLLDWTAHTARGAYLNQKRRQAGLSLKDLVDAIDVNDKTIDAWMYQGTRPSDDNIVKIANALAGGSETPDASAIARELRALYWISDVAALLAEHIGVEAVGAAINRLRRYAEQTYRTIDEEIAAEARISVLTVLVDLGVNCRYAEPLLSALIVKEADNEWCEDLRVTGLDWLRRVLLVNLRAHHAKEDDATFTGGPVLEVWDVGSVDAHVHHQHAMELSLQGRQPEAVAELAKAALLAPLDPADHFALGAVKGDMGLWSSDMALMNEGIEACWLSVALDPNWLRPWTEIGWLLLRTDRPEEALKHLLDVKPECGPLDSNYYSVLGAVYWKLGRLFEALEAFETAHALDPEDLPTLVSASETALQAGDHAKHRRYFRLARHLGASEDTEEFLELLRGLQSEASSPDASFEHDRKIAVMSAVIRLAPDDGYAYMARGRAHFAKGDVDSAIADLDAFIHLDASHAGARYIRGILYGNRKQ